MTIRITSAIILFFMFSCSKKEENKFENKLFSFKYPEGFKTDSVQVDDKTMIYGIYDVEDQRERNLFRFSDKKDFNLREMDEYIVNKNHEIFLDSNYKPIVNRDTIVNGYQGKYYLYTIKTTPERTGYQSMYLFLNKDDGVYLFEFETPNSSKKNPAIFNVLTTLRIK